MQLMQEADIIFPIHTGKPKLHCNIYENDDLCISMAKRRKFYPRTKRIAIKYLMIHSIETKEQTSDILTKPSDESLFTHLFGW